MLRAVWPLPLSLAATHRISFDFFSSPYLDVSLRGVPHVHLWIQCTFHGSSPCEFPHSDIHGSMLICSSPWLFAACHVLLRLLMPRHSPYALVRLNFRPISRSVWFSSLELLEFLNKLVFAAKRAYPSCTSFPSFDEIVASVFLQMRFTLRLERPFQIAPSQGLPYSSLSSLSVFSSQFFLFIRFSMSIFAILNQALRLLSKIMVSSQSRQKPALTRQWWR